QEHPVSQTCIPLCGRRVLVTSVTPRVENGKYIIDPWVYSERMGMYKILVNKIASYSEKFAPENKNNTFWGLPLQHGWQYSTGRLADPSQRTDCGYVSGDRSCISMDSWWADMNYFLCVLPFLAAVDSGITGISSDQHLQSPFHSFDDLLKYLRATHTSSLEDAYGSFEDRLEYYFKPEADFGRSWFVALNYLAASGFPTTLITVCKFQKGLPPRMLVNGDRAPFVTDFTNLQNAVLFGLHLVHKMDDSTEWYENKQ
ncbi:hypothetical protein HPG69_014388, partial [Diceros bicornis minor]